MQLQGSSATLQSGVDGVNHHVYWTSAAAFVSAANELHVMRAARRRRRSVSCTSKADAGPPPPPSTGAAATTGTVPASDPTYTLTKTIAPPKPDLAPASLEMEWKGTVLLEKLNFLDVNNLVADIGDRFSELVGARVYVQLVSEQIDPETKQGKRSQKACLQKWFQTPSGIAASVTKYGVSFRVGGDFGRPGAILVENEHPNPFLLKSVVLEGEKEDDQIEFSCNSWVYSPSLSGGGPRIFFSTQRYLRSQTPPGLQDLRDQELQNLRGSGEGERAESDRIYDYDVYNDLGRPDTSADYARPTLGGTAEFPYPRRCRTGRERTKTDPTKEKPMSVTDSIYVPRDEQFDRVKTSDFVGSGLKAVLHMVLPALRLLFLGTSDFKSFKDVEALYDRSTIKTARKTTLEKIQKRDSQLKQRSPAADVAAGVWQPGSETKMPASAGSGLEILREITDPSGGDASLFAFPVPQIIQINEQMWTQDYEFSRQMLAGVNPLCIERLKVFPPKSSLDPQKYGPAMSSITEDHIKTFLEDMTVQKALEKGKLYILDYHDVFMPYIERINQLKGKTYAPRALLYLTKGKILRPIAIELSLPPSSDGKASAQSRVFVPPAPGKIDMLWNLAKTHVTVIDNGFHELVSHWLRTHACVEPFIIATNRQLSAMHPVHSFLVPHYKNTMTINSMARNDLINCYSDSLLRGGIIEYGYFSGKYSSELSSIAYKGWRFHEQGLPADLIKRGMGEADPTSKHGIRLLIEDYPYAVDGLEVWDALKKWTEEYVDIFYRQDEELATDGELQAWWEEVRKKGHSDKAEEDWKWLSIQDKETLVEVLTTLTWMTSCMHAAVNFGQFAYGGFPVARPSSARRHIPEEGTQESEEFMRDKEGFYMKTIPSAFQCLIIVATLQILSYHAANEEYLGFAPVAEGVTLPAVRCAAERFRQNLRKVEVNILERNSNPDYFHRYGNAHIPYTLLMATSIEGLTGRGIPNSISI